MAKKDLSIVQVLRGTADALRHSSEYQWGHMGSCNCGYLAQQITKLKKNQIHSFAMQRYGDWSEQLSDYCPTSGLPMDDLISEMLNFGFDTDDLRHLERLSDKPILNSLPFDNRTLRFNVRNDVIKYLNAWASLIEDECVAEVTLTDLYSHPAAT